MVFRWLEAHANFRESYARAREARLEVMAEEIQYLADTSRKGIKEKRTEVQTIWTCPVCKRQCKWQSPGWQHIEDKSSLCVGVLKPKKERVFEIETTTGDTVERSKLQVDARKWLLSKLAPKKYGEHIQVDATVTTQTAADVLREARRKRLEGK